jgi:hypothetical protein
MKLRDIWEAVQEGFPQHLLRVRVGYRAGRSYLVFLSPSGDEVARYEIDNDTLNQEIDIDSEGDDC